MTTNNNNNTITNNSLYYSIIEAKAQRAEDARLYRQANAWGVSVEEVVEHEAALSRAVKEAELVRR